MDLHRNKRNRNSDALLQFKLDIKTRASSASRSRLPTKDSEKAKTERLNSLSNQSTPLLRKIRTRTVSKVDEMMSVSPELAVNVVKKYLLPMFESERKELVNKLRLDSMRFHKSKTFKEIRSYKETPSEITSLDNWDTSRTVYGDYKLSEKLAKEIESVKLELSNANKRLKEAEQAKETADSEMRNLTAKYMKSVTDQELLIFQQTTDMQSSQKLQLNSSVLYLVLGKFKELYKQACLENATLKQMLHNERFDNDIR